MKATDAKLAALAKAAGVRPPHVLFVAMCRSEMKAHFSAELCSQLAQLELHHVQRILDALGEPAKPRAARQRAAVTRLSDDWTMPEEWVVMGRDRRCWTMDVCRTEGDRFANWHRMKGNAFADWKMAWLNWIDRSNREDGTAKANAVPVETRDSALAKAAMFHKMGRHDTAAVYEAQAAVL